MADSTLPRPASRQSAVDPPREGPVLFDCDGLLLDTETCWTRAESALFARYGRQFSPEHKEALIGVALSSAGHIFERLLDQPQRGDELTAELSELVTAELARGAEPLPGAASLVGALRGIRPLGVVSNTPRKLLLHLMTEAKLAGSFDVIVGGDEVATPKPAPDLYLLAAAMLHAEPSASIALEDSPTGVASARAAGMYVIGIPSLASTVLDVDLLAPSLEHPEVWKALGVPSPLT